MPVIDFYTGKIIVEEDIKNKKELPVCEEDIKNKKELPVCEGVDLWREVLWMANMRESDLKETRLRFARWRGSK